MRHTLNIHILRRRQELIWLQVRNSSLKTIIFTSRIIREGFLINDREMESFTKMVYSEGRLTGCAVLGNLSEMENLRKSLKEEI